MRKLKKLTPIRNCKNNLFDFYLSFGALFITRFSQCCVYLHIFPWEILWPVKININDISITTSLVICSNMLDE